MGDRYSYGDVQRALDGYDCLSDSLLNDGQIVHTGYGDTGADSQRDEGQATGRRRAAGECMGKKKTTPRDNQRLASRCVASLLLLLACCVSRCRCCHSSVIEREIPRALPIMLR